MVPYRRRAMDRNRMHEEKVVTGKEAICRVWTATK
jgi:hypothetical protein